MEYWSGGGVESFGPPLHHFTTPDLQRDKVADARRNPEPPLSVWCQRVFVIRPANREILHVEVTRHPTAGWVAQQVVECCAWDRAPPRFLIHDRDSRYGVSLDRRMRGLRIRQVRSPFRSPRAHAVTERWVRSARSECLDHLIVFNEANLRRVLSAIADEFPAFVGDAPPRRTMRALTLRSSMPS